MSTFADLYPDGQWGPEDLGFLAWMYDPISAFSSQQITAGSVYGFTFNVRQPTGLSSFTCFRTSATGSTPTAGQNWGGLYDPDLNMVSQVGLDSVVEGSGITDISIPYALNRAGRWRFAFVFNGSAMPTFSRAINFQNLVTAGLAGTDLRWFVSGTSQTTLPARLTTFTPTAFSLWGALRR